MKLLHAEPIFHQRLRYLDYELVLEIKKSKCCPKCKGQLDTRNFPRKVRGVPDGEAYATRYSLCCRREGCRAGLTPPSLRFLGRKGYAAIIIILALDFHKSLGLNDLIARRTLARWRDFWRNELSEESIFMRQVRASGRLPVGTSPGYTPKGILHALGFPKEEAWIQALKLFTQF